MGVSGNLWISLKDANPLVVYDVESGMATKPMQGKYASFGIDLGYTNLFCLPEVTSEFFSSCDSLVGDSLESIKQIEAPYVFDWENAIPLHAIHGNRASSCGEREVS